MRSGRGTVLTMDKNLEYQQNLAGRQLAIVGVLRSDKSLDADTHQQRTTRRAADRAPRGTLPVRPGHLQRHTASRPASDVSRPPITQA